MAHSNTPPTLDNPMSSLSRWIFYTLGQRQVGRDRRSQVKFRIQGNHLHILLEMDPCPDCRSTSLRLLYALQRTDINTLLPQTHPPLYQIFLYGRDVGQRSPAWRFPIYLNQIDRHLEQLQPTPPLEASQEPTPSPQTVIQTADGDRPTAVALEERPVAVPPASTDEPPSALVLSNLSLAKRGDVNAIARYLSETLSKLGVAVNVSAKTLAYTVSAANVTADPTDNVRPKQRLWITCEAGYSPDPAMIAEPIAQQLRDLQLQDFRDAIALVQVRGEAKPDWLLRVDLTPATEILREWARWGDVEAISRLVNQTLSCQDITLETATLKQFTLHLSCKGGTESGTTIPEAPIVKAALQPLLETLGPQGIHAAALYGHNPANPATPAWVEWLELPGAIHPALAESPLELARQGDWSAIAFLLSRLLNPQLEQFLATGGIRIQLLPKGDLLHVMTDAPVCPSQPLVGKAIAKFLQPLHIPKIAGVRIYGRRAGQKRPTWSYGMDFVPRQRLVPEAVPEFAATDSYLGDLITRPDEPILRPDLTPADIRDRWRSFQQQSLQAIQQFLVRSHLFALTTEAETLVSLRDRDSESSTETTPRAIAQQQRVATLIWGTLGLLLSLQATWGLGQWLQATTEDVDATIAPPGVIMQPSVDSDGADPAAIAPNSSEPMPMPDDLGWQTSTTPGDETFDGSGFTRPAPPAIDPSSNPLPHLPPLPRSGSEDFLSADPRLEPSGAAPILWTIDSPLPTFNSPQLDQKLALYYALLEESGPPDVLIVGSSRALRGVDPSALRAELAELGYEDVSVFNFGINGATAQVVELILRRILTPNQLPRLILWADGARALNSGRVDVTYNGIAVSEGYRQLTAGTLPIPDFGSREAIASSPSLGGLSVALSASYESLDRWLSDRLADRLGLYDERDRLKHLMQRQWVALTPQPPLAAPLIAVPGEDGTTPGGSSTLALTDQDAVVLDQGVITYDGFLPLQLEFNPATYYQQYARVSGTYDRDYEAFQLQGKQVDAMNAVLQLTEEHQIPLVFVNLPLTDQYLDPARQQYEQTFRQYFIRLSTQHESFIFRDLGEAWLTQYSYFSDPSHLNRYGAYAVSHRLAQDPLIPWEVTTAPSP